YTMFDVKRRWSEEWPSETYNYQDKFSLNNLKSMKVKNLNNQAEPSVLEEDSEIIETVKLSEKELKNLLKSIDGIGTKKYNRILEEVGSVEEVIGVLHQSPSILLNIKGITKKIVEKITKKFAEFKL
ncbi:MAG: helix-hairpin-helix domain-containing protein, partial [Arcobacteraceae bacterium]